MQTHQGFRTATVPRLETSRPEGRYLTDPYELGCAALQKDSEDIYRRNQKSSIDFVILSTALSRLSEPLV